MVFLPTSLGEARVARPRDEHILWILLYKVFSPSSLGVACVARPLDEHAPELPLCVGPHCNRYSAFFVTRCFTNVSTKSTLKCTGAKFRLIPPCSTAYYVWRDHLVYD